MRLQRYLSHDLRLRNEINTAIFIILFNLHNCRPVALFSRRTLISSIKICVHYFCSSPIIWYLIICSIFLNFCLNYILEVCYTYSRRSNSLRTKVLKSCSSRSREILHWNSILSSYLIVSLKINISENSKITNRKSPLISNQILKETISYRKCNSSVQVQVGRLLDK